MNIFSKITAKTMRVNRVRTVVTIIGVILSTSMITAVATFGTSFQRFLVNYSIAMNGNWHAAVSGTDAGQAEDIREHEDVAKAAVLKVLGYAWFEPVVKQSPQIPYLYVRALSEEALKMLPAMMQEGRMPRTEDEIAVPSVLLANEDRERQTKIGDTLTLVLGERSYQGERLGQSNEYMDEEFEENETFTPKETRTFTVVGIYDNWPDVSYGGAGYDVLAGPAKEETEYQDVFIELKEPREVFDFAEKNLTKGGTVVFYNHELLRWLGIVDNSNIIAVLGGLLMVLIVVIMTGSITLIYNAFSISLRERTVQFGLLSSIGATKKQLRRAMRYEAFFVSAIGIPLGILAGIGGIGVTLHYIGGGLTNWIHGTDVGIPLYVPVWAVVFAAVTAFITIMISVWIPSRRIRKITPMEAIRASADIRVRPDEVKTRQWVASVFGLEGMMAQKNYRRDRRKYRATVISLTLSIALFTAAGLFNMYLVGTGTFVLEAPKTDLECRIHMDVADHEKDVEDVIHQTEGIQSVSKYYQESFSIEVPAKWVQEGVLNYFAQEIEPYVSAVMIVLEDQEFERFAKEQKINAADYQDCDHVRLMYLNVFREYNLETERYEKKEIFPEKPEGMFEMGHIEYDEEGTCSGFKKSTKFEMADAVGTVPDAFMNYRGQIALFLPMSMYQKFFAESEGDYLSALYTMQCENPAEVYRNLEQKFKEQKLDEIGYLENKREEYETDRNTIIAIKVLTYGFVILISLIAAANVFHTISTNLMLRRKEFAMLRSMGMSPKGFRKMMNYECLIYGVSSLIYGFVFTLLISAALYRSIGAGADVEYLIPWSYLAASAVGVFGVVFLTMMYTMRGIQKNNIIEELKMT